ncbi:C3a anaphylatoxin chemotactic receptor-like [Gastrophryne carolinensis]
MTVPEDDIDPQIYQAIKTLNIILFSISFILGTFGNGLVIWIAGLQIRKTITIIWFLNLALADLLLNFCFPFEITELILDDHWPFGQVMCKIVFSVTFLNMCVCTSFLTIISIDRCITIMFPIWSKKHRTPKLAFAVSLFNWAFCLILSSLYSSFYNIDYDLESNISYCLYLYSKDDEMDESWYKVILVIRFIFMFLIPFSVIFICHRLVTHRLRQRRKPSKSSRPIKILVTMVLCFFGFWFPFHLWPLLEYFFSKIHPNVDFVVSETVQIIGFFSSFDNPIIYAFVGRNFKKSFRKSFPLLLESTFQEEYETDTKCELNMIETVKEV